ncbi:MAG: hypothetical protein ABEJ84_08550 [Halodesulfurarchaeum sp.]
MADHETNGDRTHLEDVPDGCGCAEMWEMLSEQREKTAPEDGD